MCLFFFFNDTATTEIYTLSLHDALPISRPRTATMRPAPGTSTPVVSKACTRLSGPSTRTGPSPSSSAAREARSEEHTSELQSRQYLVCRLLLEKKKKKYHCRTHIEQSVQ